MMNFYHFTLCLSLSVWSSQGLKLADPVADSGVKVAESLDGTKTAHVYVINLSDREDRCHCMARQLAESPFQLFRQEASTPSTLDECPSGKGVGEYVNEYEEAVFCSNQNIYDRVNQTKEVDQPDFIITMEDDLRLHNRTTFWPKVESFLNSECSTNDNWDVLAVDTFGVGGKSEPDDLSMECKEGFQVYSSMTGKPYGAHFLIIKKHAIPKLLKQRKHPQDHFGHLKRAGLKVHYWRPRLVGQMSQGPDSHRKVEKCSKSVGGSDIIHTGNIGDLFKGAGGWFGLKTNKRTYSLQCEE